MGTGEENDGKNILQDETTPVPGKLPFTHAILASRLVHLKGTILKGLNPQTIETFPLILAGFDSGPWLYGNVPYFPSSLPVFPCVRLTQALKTYTNPKEIYITTGIKPLLSPCIHAFLFNFLDNLYSMWLCVHVCIK